MADINLSPEYIFSIHVTYLKIPESACEGFFVKIICRTTFHTSSHLHLCTSTFSTISLLIFTSAHLHLCSSSSSSHIYITAHLSSSSSSHIYISAHLRICTPTSLLIFTSSHLQLTSSPLALLNFLSQGRGQRRRTAMKRNPLRRSCASRARKAGESAICPGRGQPSAGIVRVECAKCRRECDLVLSRATLCGDRACRVREMQARVRCVPVRDNPLRGSCVSSARNAGESAI